MLKVKGILLDLDGTIVDSKEAYVEAFKAALSAIGRKNIDVEKATEIPRRLEQNLPIDDLVGKANVQRFLEAYLKTYYETTVRKGKLMPHTAETLSILSKKAKLALITMRHVSKGTIIRELEKFGIAKYFQSVVTALNTHHPKPSPEAFKKCAETLGVKINECIVVGDSVADIRAGREAGAKTVAVLSGIFSREELERENPDFVIENIGQLLKILKQ